MCRRQAGLRIDLVNVKRNMGSSGENHGDHGDLHLPEAFS